MKKFYTLFVAVLAIFAFVQMIRCGRHFSPRVQVADSPTGHFVNVSGYQLDAQTWVVPCKIGDFFRVAADNKTVITQFIPNGMGWAIIRFEYVK
jgi:hypothetical protein